MVQADIYTVLVALIGMAQVVLLAWIAASAHKVADNGKNGHDDTITK